MGELGNDVVSRSHHSLTFLTLFSYITYGGGPLALWICMMAAPDSRLETWARKQAEKELLEEYGPELVTPAEWKKTI